MRHIEASSIKSHRHQALLNNRIKHLKDLALALLKESETLEAAAAYAPPMLIAPIHDQTETSGELAITDGINFHDEVREFEIYLIKQALIHTKGNQKQAARLLSMKATTLHAKIKAYNIQVIRRIK
jgi:DNA-binding NtrC family response regulator